MTRHLFLPLTDLENVPATNQQALYLEAWRDQAVEDADDGDTASSACLQGALIELTLYGRLQTDWLGIMDAYLVSPAGFPLAYSDAFGLRLYRFEAQTEQSTIHATHARWWIDCLTRPSAVDHAWYADKIERKHVSGLYFDHDVSDTVGRHRMRSEIMQSTAQSLEILEAAAAVNHALKMNVACGLAGLPQTGYVSAEYFRYRSLLILGEVDQMPAGTGGVAIECAASIGFCDFAIGSKIDAYMGTAKRIARDVAVHSPLAAAQVAALLPAVTDEAVVSAVMAILAAYVSYMEATPMEIPAFQMREVPLPFGADITPIEVISVAHLLEAIPRP